MRKTMLWALAAVALAASPAFAVQPVCKGEACASVTPVMVDGCWAYRNTSARTVRGMISTTEITIFEIGPGAIQTPKFRNGVCFRTAYPYSMIYLADPATRRPLRK